jgi:hypothetical protein
MEHNISQTSNDNYFKTCTILENEDAGIFRTTKVEGEVTVRRN